MDSRLFIRQSAILSTKIQSLSSQKTTLTSEELTRQRGEVQRELTILFSGLQNPTLPSALKLVTDALAEDYTILPRIITTLQEADKNAWTY